MRSIPMAAGTTLMAAGMLFSCDIAVVQATPEEVVINGTYRAVSDGEWAKLNHQMHTMETVTSIWTINTTCTSSLACTGQVSSDQGWSAPIDLNTRQWLITREVEGWQRCSDGSTFPGHRHYKFRQVNRNDIYSKVPVGDFEGYEDTLGPSGACGNFQWLHVEMPFTLVKIG